MKTGNRGSVAELRHQWKLFQDMVIEPLEPFGPRQLDGRTLDLMIRVLPQTNADT